MTSLSDKLSGGNFIITSELTPPKGIDVSEFIARGKLLKDCVDACNVTDSHSSRMSLAPLAAAFLLSQEGLEPIMQMTTRDRNRIALQADMLAASVMGIKNLVLMGGDPPHLGDHPEAKPVFDLATNELIGAANGLNAGKDFAGNKLQGATDLHIGAVVNPGADNLELEIRRLEEKVAAGAKFFQTQAIYDVNSFAAFADQVKHLKVKLLAGILPVKSRKMALFMNDKVPGIQIPDDIINEIDTAGDVKKTSAAIAARIIEQLKDCCVGVHLMTLGWEDQVPVILKAAKLL